MSVGNGWLRWPLVKVPISWNCSGRVCREQNARSHCCCRAAVKEGHTSRLALHQSPVTRHWWLPPPRLRRCHYSWSHRLRCITRCIGYGLAAGLGMSLGWVTCGRGCRGTRLRQAHACRLQRHTHTCCCKAGRMAKEAAAVHGYYT